jgi:MoaA/NifB/PqqE/SkfB family radical SAM enzyme
MSLRSFYYDLKTLQGIFLHSSPRCGPRIAQINISDDCNLDCVICNRSSMGVGGLLDTDKVLTLVKELDGMGTQEIYYHGFGEPACHPRLPEMVRHVSAHCPGLRQHIVTNGTWDSPELRRALTAGKVRMRFSLHAGDEDTWKRIHPHDDSSDFIRARDNLRSLTASMAENIEVLYVICRANCHAIDRMVDFAKENGVRKILFRPMRLFKNCHGAYMNDSLMPTDQEYQKAAALIAHYQTDLRGRISVQSVPFEQNSYDPGQGRPSSRAFYLSRSCYIGYVLTVIERDGNVWGCLPESSDGRPLGNIHNNSFREIWHGEDYVLFRRKQLFLDKAILDHKGCHSYCQHLETNIRLNRIKPWRQCMPAAGPGAK